MCECVSVCVCGVCVLGEGGARARARSLGIVCMGKMLRFINIFEIII